MKYMTTDEFTNDSGFIDVGDGHQIWWHDWGNKNATTPIFHLHGGPGSGNKDKYKLRFDPLVQRVIFHDQRGSGQSTPFGDTEHNTTQNLVADMDALREKLGFNKIMISGGSWGSTLGLVYAIEHPQRVAKMLLSGIFLGTKAEADHIVQGGLQTHYPEAWAQFIEVVPEEQRHDTVSFYKEKMQKNDDKSLEYVRRWCLLEGTASDLDGDYKKDLMYSYEVDESLLSLALLEAHYFQNNCFLPDNFIITHAHKLKSIPVVLMQGRQDHVCPPAAAYAVTEAIGTNCHLHIMPGGHAATLALREVMSAYIFAFLKD